MKAGPLIVVGVVAGVLLSRRPKRAPKKPSRVPIGGWTAAPPRPVPVAPTPQRANPSTPSRTNP